MSTQTIFDFLGMATWKTREHACSLADQLFTALNNFEDCPSTENLCTLNGLWAQAYRLMGFPDPTPDDKQERKVA